MEGKFNIYVHSDSVEGGMQQIIFDKGDVEDLALVKQRLQSELCFIDPTQSIIAGVSYRTPEGQWLPLEAMSSGGGRATATSSGHLHVSPPNSPSPLLSPFNPIHKASLAGDVSMTIRVTTEPNILAAKDAIIFEGITRLLLAELLGKNNVVAMGTVDRLIHDVRCHAAENLTLSAVELLKSPPFARLQHGLSAQILKAIASTAADLGTVCTTIPSSTLGAQIAASIIPQIYRQAAAKSLADTNLKKSAGGGGAGVEVVAGSGLHAVRSSNTSGNNSSAAAGAAVLGSSMAATSPPPETSPTAAPFARNKAVRSNKASASLQEQEEEEDTRNVSTADRRTSELVSPNNVGGRSEAGNYRGAAASLAAAARRSDPRVPTTPAAVESVKAQQNNDSQPVAASVLRQTSSYTNYDDVGARSDKRNDEKFENSSRQHYSERDNRRDVDVDGHYRSRNVASEISSSSGYGAQSAAGGGTSFTAKDKITIYCVYSGATSQRAKAIQVSRANPAFDVVMQTLTYKFGSEVVLGFINPETGECSEVLSNEELKALIRNCDADSLTLQCWAKQSIKFDADIVDTEFERRMAAVDFGTGESRADYGHADEDNGAASSRGEGGRNKAARPTSSGATYSTPSRLKSAPPSSPPRHTESGGYNINSHPLAEKPPAWEEYTRASRGNPQSTYTTDSRRPTSPAPNASASEGGNASAGGRSLIAAARNKAARPAGSAILEQASARGVGVKPRLTSSALSRVDDSFSQRGVSPMSARSGGGRNKSARPTSARHGGGAMSTMSRGGVSSRSYGKPSFTPSHKLDVSGTAWNEQQLREIFDQFDKDNNGLLDREEMMDYFYTYHDDMGIVDAKNKFVQLLDEVPEFKDGKLTFDEFAVIMLKIAQW